MLRKILTPVMLIVLAVPLLAQQPYNGNIDMLGYFNAINATWSAPFTPVTVDPTGTCPTLLQIVVNSNTGALTGCISVSGTLTWTRLNSGSLNFANIVGGVNSPAPGSPSMICGSNCSGGTSGTGTWQATSLIGTGPFSASGMYSSGTPTAPSGGFAWLVNRNFQEIDDTGVRYSVVKISSSGTPTTCPPGQFMNSVQADGSPGCGTVGTPLTATLGTGALSANTCSSAITVAVTGAATTSVIAWDFASDPSGVTGYGSSSGLEIKAYATSGNANFKVCNRTGSSITPGAMTLNFRAMF